MFYVAKFLEFFYKYDTTYVIISTFKSVCPSGVGSSRIQRSYQRGATARLDGAVVQKMSKHHFFLNIKNSFHGVTQMGLEPHQIFFSKFF